MYLLDLVGRDSGVGGTDEHGGGSCEAQHRERRWGRVDGAAGGYSCSWPGSRRPQKNGQDKTSIMSAPRSCRFFTRLAEEGWGHAGAPDVGTARGRRWRSIGAGRARGANGSWAPGATAHSQEDPRRNLAAGYNIGRPTWGQVMSFRYSTYEQTSALYDDAATTSRQEPTCVT